MVLMIEDLEEAVDILVEEVDTLEEPEYMFVDKLVSMLVNMLVKRLVKLLANILVSVVVKFEYLDWMFVYLENFEDTEVDDFAKDMVAKLIDFVENMIEKLLD